MRHIDSGKYLLFRDRRPHLVYLFFNKTKFASSLKIKCRMVCRWLNLDSAFYGFLLIFCPVLKIQWKTNWNPPIEFNAFKKISYNPRSMRKKFNLLNRRVIWLYIDDTALLCLHPVWEGWKGGTRSAVGSCQGSHVRHCPLQPFLMLLYTGIAASLEKDVS